MTKITKNDQKERKIYIKKSKKTKKNPKSDNLKKIFCQKSDFLSVSKYWRKLMLTIKIYKNHPKHCKSRVFGR